jgi:hypothetical protein
VKAHAMKPLTGKSTVEALLKQVADIGKTRPGPVEIDVHISGRVLTIRLRMIAVDGVPVASSPEREQ